jgi:xanthine dehydrogenase large subunit
MTISPQKRPIFCPLDDESSMKHDTITKATEAVSGTVHTNRHHDSAEKHVTGRAEYCDDIGEPQGTLHAYLGVSSVAHGLLKSMDLSAVLAAPGVVGVLTADDIPGVNDISPTCLKDEPRSAARTICIWKAISPSPFPARMMT